MSRPFPSRHFSSSGSFVRVNGKIRAREVRVIGADGKQIGVLSLGEALTLARSQGLDLVEIQLRIAGGATLWATPDHKVL
ncbi:MAG TPA: hypothetical protein PKH32_08265, partial [Verrucomicrobiota bacterium]|nr:hypothetical protein [Verrucomicrobiota bacterium]